MTAIIKKELKTYFTSMTGYIFLGFLVLLTGLFFSMINVSYQNPYYADTLSSCAILFLILIPTLTMRLFAEEARQKTDQLLYTSPITVNQIVIGKFIAATVLFLIGMGITILFPLILTRFGNVPFAETAGAFVGYVLLGICYIGVGIFISSLTENQIVAAVATFAALFILFILDGVQSIMPTDRVSSMVFIALVAGVLAFVIYDSTKNIYASIIFLIICAAACVGLYLFNNLIFDGVIAKVFSWFSLMKRFENFHSGILYLEDIVYYLAFSLAFVYLTINGIEKRRWK